MLLFPEPYQTSFQIWSVHLSVRLCLSICLSVHPSILQLLPQLIEQLTNDGLKKITENAFLKIENDFKKVKMILKWFSSLYLLYDSIVLYVRKYVEMSLR